MQRIGIVIADAARARLFTFDRKHAREVSSEQTLVERADLVDPARRQRPSEIFSDTRPGTFHGPTGRGYAASDHREDHLRELDRRFAREIAGELESMIGEHDCASVIVAASSAMLGFLRDELRSLPQGLPVDEIGSDLTRLSVAELHDHLAQLGFLPTRARRGVA